MPWPNWVLTKFTTIRGGIDQITQESQLYGPYNTMLQFLFPPQEDYMIVPQYQRPQTGQSIDFTTIFIVEHALLQTPIFYLEVKPPAHINDMSKREQADNQMRDRVREFIEELQIPRLHGVSAIGVRVAFYEYDAATKILDPPLILRDPICVNDTAPAERWNTDVLSEYGFQLMVQVAAHVKEMAHALRGSA